MTQAPSTGTDPDLRYYLRVIARRKWLIALIVLVCVAGALVYSFVQPKRFEATASVILDGGRGRSALTPGATLSSTTIEQNTGIESSLMQGESMRAAMFEKLGYEPEVSISTPDKVAAVRVTGKGNTGAVAAKQANDFVQAFAELRELQIQGELTTALDGLRSERESLDARNAELFEEVQDVSRQIDATTDPATRRELEFKKQRLEYEYSNGVIAQQLSDIRTSEAALQQELSQSTTRGNFTLALAQTPSSPVSPKPLLYTLIALATGLMVGIAIAFARDYFDDTLRTKEDLDAVTGGIPVLSIVPQLNQWRERDTAVLESVERPQSAVSEAYRNLRSALDFASLDHKISLVHLTSSNAGEGKTTTAANLAVTIARADRRVILVDCDLRRPRLHEFFGLSNDRGFTSVLLGECSVQDALRRPDRVPNLLVLTSGPPPPNPSELLSTKAAEELLSALTQPADMVIIDSPPLLPVSDATILARYAHSTLLVVAARSTTRRSLGRSLEMLSQIDAPLEGVVLNGTGEEASYGGTYGYAGYVD